MLRSMLTKPLVRPTTMRRLRGRRLRLLSLEDRLAPAMVTVYVFNSDYSINLPGNPIEDAKINVGDTIRWQWIQGKHTTTSAAGQAESWASPLTNQEGFTFDHTFTKVGAFNYYCTLHGADIGGGQVSGMAGTIIVGDATVPPGPTLLDPLTQPRFVNALPIPTVMQPTTPGGTHYDIAAMQVEQNLGLINPSNGQSLLTTVWGYNGTYPAATIEATRNQPITVNWSNQLISGGTPLPHLLQESIMMPMPASGVPIVTHLHGGHTESASDGIPDAWFTPNFVATGPDFRQQTYQYDNDQPAATLWYHDHAEGITPYNVYAGLAGFYLLREPFETGLNLPTGAYEIPMVFQDRMFDTDGELVYPPAVMASGAVGNFILVNGKAWPSLEVEPRKYRFRMLNGSDSRTYNMSLSVNGGGTAPVFVQIGSDQGFLPASRSTTSFQLSPGDRMDVILDFSDPALFGKTIIINNSAPAPLPGGTAPDPATVGQLMAFKVTKPLMGTDTSVVPTTIRPMPDPGPSTNSRQLLLSMGDGPMGLSMFLGTVAAGRMAYDDPVTESINLNTTETWEFYNDTPVAHPIHIHQVQFQVISHQGYTATTDPITGALSSIQLVGTPLLPRPEYTGPKDTVMVEPGEVLRVIAKFDLPGEYVWHCHMLTHENNDMMRPLMVTPKVTVGDVSVIEGNSGQSSVTFTVSLNGAADWPVTVNYATAAGTADVGTDFQSVSGTVSIPLGATSATITVPVFGDTTIESNETFFLNLSGATGGVAITDSQAKGTIVNDDIGFQINDGSAQRSRVTQLTVFFGIEIAFVGAPEAAFQLSGPSGPVQLTATPSVVNNTTQVLLTFNGAGTDFGSLADGLYTLNVFSNQVVGGLPGGNYTSATGAIHRLFGDSNGDRTVNSVDFAAFRSFFGLGASIFDFDNDGQTNSTDFAEFRKRFGLMI